METLTRADAGRRLASGLRALLTDAPVIVALSPGGARVASEIARALEAPLDVFPARRLEVCGRPHSTFGAVADGATLILPDRVEQLRLPPDYVRAMAARAHREVDLEAAAWRGGAPPLRVTGRTVVLADDGRSDPVTVVAATGGLRDLGALQVVYAAPYAPPALADAVQAGCDHCLLLYDNAARSTAFVCDSDFSQTTRIDVRSMVRRSRPDLANIAGG